jgi:hypothetical protein
MPSWKYLMAAFRQQFCQKLRENGRYGKAAKKIRDRWWMASAEGQGADAEAGLGARA